MRCLPSHYLKQSAQDNDQEDVPDLVRAREFEKDPKVDPG
jgi:hypothetical protein